MANERVDLILSDVHVNIIELKSEKVLTFADLPFSILEMIMYLLVLKDNIRASAVCKAWYIAAKAVRVAEKHPWIVSLPKRGDLITLFDPLVRKMYTLNLPEIDGASFCYSKEGWLLMRKSNLVDMFFFNPYTHELINLPKCELSFQAIAFSCAPTSSTCVLVALKPVTKYLVAISTYYHGASEWITKEFPCSLAFDPYMHSNLVYSNGHFCCFTSGGSLFNFDPASCTLNHQAWAEHKCPYMHSSEWMFQPKRIYLMEQKGELILMYTCSSSDPPMVYKLVSAKREELSNVTLDGLTIFASLYSSEARLNVPRMRNSVYFPRYGLHSKRCVYYSFDECRYYPREVKKPTKIWQMQKELCILGSIWIEPPSNDVLETMSKVV